MSQEADKALILAESYIEEISDTLNDTLKNDLLIDDLSNSDALLFYQNLKATKKQIDKVKKIDPNHNTVKELEGGDAVHIKLPEVEVDYLICEGITDFQPPYVLLHKLRALNDLKKAEDIIIKNPDIFSSGPKKYKGVRVYYIMAIVYAEMGQKGKALESINKSLELSDILPQEQLIELEKMKDRIENTSLIKMKINSFYGKWQILLFLVGFMILSLVGATAGGEPAEGIFLSVIFGGLTWIYYFFCTR